jgi:cytochrome c556
MINIKTLLPELRTLVTDLAEDLLARSTADDKIDAGLRDAFKQIEKGGRTAQAFEVWRDDYLDQVAVAWVLACVFVRFMEDNHLIDECWLAGEGDRRKLAEGAHELFFRKHPHDSDREYFEHVFREVGKIPAAKELFAEGKTPLWAVGPSGDAAMKLLAFLREIDPEEGHLLRSFEVEKGDTRFLGDLYQDLSEKARKKYALLQTPVFVEEFILDRTLTPALDEFGLDKVRLIDPTCGSGHFLLGAFTRLFDQWIKRESNEIKAAQKALDGVWGVDINPFAVAIARFRLIVAAVQACGIKRLKQAPGWTIHLAAGDSLLFGSKPGWKGERTLVSQQWNLFEVDPIYAVEDRQVVNQILGQGYHVVVGNPPYIIVRDRKLNSAYRELYSTCHQKFSLGVPFTQRFWELATQPGGANGGCGYIGMITANSFMKREFGKKLIEEFFPKVDLTHVIDTSGAYIPGHGTPTVILLGRARKPVGDTVRAVLGIKGEATTPEDASQGYVWQSIVRQIDSANVQDEYTSTADVSRTTFNAHPWSIGGGGTAELKEQLDESVSDVLGNHADSIGITAVTGEDDLYVFPRHQDTLRLRTHHTISLVLGDMIRDHVLRSPVIAFWPYDHQFRLLPEEAITDLIRQMWPLKTAISQRRRFGTPMLLKGAKWYEWQELYHDKLRTPLSIIFGEIATHNHFVLDRGGKVFKHSAQIIKLSRDADENCHLKLLGLLNSSTACFWMKQACHDKGGGGIGGGLATEYWEHFFDFTGTKLQRFPMPVQKPLTLAQQIDTLASQYGELLPDTVVAAAPPNAERLAHARMQAEAIWRRMVAFQEELDWQCYQLYGLVSENLCYTGDDLPDLSLGQRAFEIVMARQMANGELQTTWFERHGSTPITEIPTHWPAAFRKLVERRIELIETSKEVGLIEKPEYKRRWNAEPWGQQEQQALRTWLLDSLERQSHGSTPELTTVARLADKASGNAEFMQVAALYRGRPDFDVAALVAELVEGEAVPFLPVFRYKPSGLRKWEVWERTWDLQREEDRLGQEIEQLRQQVQTRQKELTGKPSAEVDKLLNPLRGEIQMKEQEWKEFGHSIAVPPKYASADFQKTDYWRLRGKLDVPKERWVSYSHCQTESDPSLVIGWAGWNHLEQATALVGYYDARKREGWDARRLTPLLAGLDQLLPWIHQWHPEIDKEFGETAGQSFQTMLEHDAHELGLTLEEIRAWKPEPRNTRTTRKKKGESS